MSEQRDDLSQPYAGELVPSTASDHTVPNNPDPQQRESGWYWVRKRVAVGSSSTWIAAYWNSKWEGWISGKDVYETNFLVQDVGPRIPMPDDPLAPPERFDRHLELAAGPYKAPPRDLPIAHRAATADKLAAPERPALDLEKLKASLAELPVSEIIRVREGLHGKTVPFLREFLRALHIAEQVNTALPALIQELESLQKQLASAVRERDELQGRLGNAKRLQDLTLTNEIRWMQKHDDLLRAIASLRDWKSPDGVLQVHNLKWFEELAPQISAAIQAGKEPK